MKLLFFGFAEGEGFVLARILGEQMNPAAFLQLADSLEESDFQFLSDSVSKGYSQRRPAIDQFLESKVVFWSYRFKL